MSETGSKLLKQGIRWNALAMAAAAAVATLVAAPAAQAQNIYDARDNGGATSDLIVSSGTIFIDTDALVLQVNGGSFIAGLDESGVAVWQFNDVNVASGVMIDLDGNRPLAITAVNDLIWGANINASAANTDGTVGGGTGGGGGAGGSGLGTGGPGATGGGGGGGSPVGGTGRVANTGNPGAARNDGLAGQSGSQGAAGDAGDNGFSGTPGSGLNAAGSVGALGTGGSGGGASSVNTNRGLGANVTGGGGAGGSPIGANNPSNGSVTTAPGTGVAGTPGEDGDDATPGAAGNPGGIGNAGGNATFTTDPSTLSLAGGYGGGGGGGGGQGGGGQGGGKGGGGSSGGGGGAGAGFNAGGNCGTSVDRQGRNGGAGGAGGTGGNGGAGGTAATAGAGGTGADAGGAVLLAARGYLEFTGQVNVSAEAPAGGGSALSDGVAPVGGQVVNNGDAGSGQGAAVPNATWQFLQGGYCTGDGSAAVGSGGSGGAGGSGGNGSVGGSAGTSRSGGSGGRATPGMLQLQGSVVNATTGEIVANEALNGTGPANGKLSVVSNLASPLANAPTQTPAAVVEGTVTNNSVLTSGNSFDAVSTHPIIGQLVAESATEGVLDGTFFNSGDVTAPGIDNVELVILGAGVSPFAGFDQIFVINNTGTTQTGIQLQVGAGAAVSLPASAPGISVAGELPANAIFTTTVVSGTPVSLLQPVTLTTNVSPAGGGTVGANPPGPTYAPGTNVTVTATANPNFTFLNWTGNVDNATSNPTTITVNVAETVTANFDPDTFTVTYGDGSLSGDTDIDFGETIVVTVTEPTGQDVDVVSATNGTVTPIGGGQFELSGVTANTTVNVTFVNAVYNVTYVPGANVSGDPTIDFGETITVTVTEPANQDVDTVVASSGVVTPVGGGQFQLSGVTADVTVTATFIPETYTVTYTPAVNFTGDANIDFGETIPFTVTSPTGFDLATPATDVTATVGTVTFIGGTEPTFNFELSGVTADTEVTATFTPETYNVTYADTEVTGDPTIDFGETITLTVVAPAGTPNVGGSSATPTGTITFVSGTSPNFTYELSDVSSDTTVDFTFVSTPTFNVTGQVVGTGTIAPAGTTAVLQNNTLGFTITPDICTTISDVTFNGSSVLGDVSIDGNGVGTYTTPPITADATVEATFVDAGVTFGITIVDTVGGTITGPTTVNCDDTPLFDITSDSANGFFIQDVLVDSVSIGGSFGSGITNRTFTFPPVRADAEITAVYGVETFTVTATAGANGSVSPAGATVVNFGDDLTITVTPDATFGIADVLVDSVSVGALSTVELTDIQADTTVEASFAPITTVPDVVALPQATAESDITTASLTVGTVSIGVSDVVGVGEVISQNPAGGSQVGLGAPVDIVVSIGSPLSVNYTGDLFIEVSELDTEATATFGVVQPVFTGDPGLRTITFLWSEVGGTKTLPAIVDQPSLTFGPGITSDDAGTYICTVNDGISPAATSPQVTLAVTGGVPAGSAAGLALLSAAIGLGTAIVLRRKR